jgi:RNA polymerase sigma factor (sigma-70 family)
MPAIFSRVGVLDTEQVKIFFPIGTFLIQWGCAKAGFNPLNRPGGVRSRLLHVMLVFITRDGAAAQTAVLDGFQKCPILAFLNPSFDKITHNARANIPDGWQHARYGRARSRNQNKADALQWTCYTIPMPEDAAEKPSSHQWFVTTHWSVVVAAGKTDSTRAQAALEALCRSYWYPLYAYVRRLGHKPHDAEDLVQAFFAQCLEKNYLRAADQGKGRFRSFLLIALKRFLANEWDKAHTQKRGGGEILISLDGLVPEERYALEPAQVQNPETLYERRWALILLEQVLAKLEAEQRKTGNLQTFSELKGFLTGGANASYAEIGDRLGMSEGAVKVAVHRLRQRYRRLLEDEIANTVSSPEEVQEERRYLLSVLGRM